MPIALDVIRNDAEARCAPYIAANTHVDYAAQIDHTTDNILLKVYHRDKAEDLEIALGAAITRRLIEDSPDLGAKIDETWLALTEAINQRPVPEEWKVVNEDKAIKVLAFRSKTKEIYDAHQENQGGTEACDLCG